ncbi:hypothetical protein ACHAQH_001650 [Verticillium albo-atrum]
MAIDKQDLERSKFEILLLAFTLLILVSMLGIVLFFGAGLRANRGRAASESRESLCNSIRWEHDDESETDSGQYDESFVDNVRRRSVSLAGGVQRELAVFRRKSSIGSVSSVQSSLLWDLGGTCSRGLRQLSNDFSALFNPVTDRHDDVELLVDGPEDSAASAYEVEHLPGTRRRSSQVVFLDVLAESDPKT